MKKNPAKPTLRPDEYNPGWRNADNVRFTGTVNAG
jgi:hypothetical protein